MRRNPVVVLTSLALTVFVAGNTATARDEQTTQQSKDIAKNLREVQANPQSEQAVINLGKAYFVAGMLNEALEQFQTAVSLAPNDPTARYEVGSAYMSLKDYGNAIETLRRAVALKPDYVKALGLLAFAYNSVEQYDQ